MTDSPDPRALPVEKPPEPQRDPVRRWTTIVAALLLLLLTLQIASDRTAPVSAIGTVEGLVLPISSRVTGELLRVAVADNQTVEPGDLLAEIDPTPFRLAVEAAEAELEQAGQSIGASTAEVASAAANVAEAQALLTNSRAQAERTLELVARGVTPAARGDEARADVASDEAAVAAAEADLRARRGGARTARRQQSAAARGAVGIGDGAVQPEPDADRGADARARHELQPRAGRDGDGRAAAPEHDRPARRLDRRVLP